MNISLKLLKEMQACTDGIDWYKQVGKPKTLDQCLPLVISNDGFKYANWFLTEKFTKEQNQKYALFCAELLLSIFESKYPRDKRPRECVEAIKVYIDNPSQNNKDKLNAAAYAAAAANAAYAADAAADAAYAANAAADATYAAYYAVRAADAANAAADAAAYAACANNSIETKTKILEYGLKLLKGNE